MAEVTEDRIVNVGLIYNVFDPSTLVWEKLIYQSGNTLAQYVEGLPDSCEWKIGLNGIPIDVEDYDEVVVAENDVISVVCVPEGNDILRMVALLAIVVVAAVVFGPSSFAILGLSHAASFALAFGVTVAVGSFLVNMALPPTTPKLDSTDDGTSYGYDGAKNTAHEGVSLPVVYGSFNVGGNYVDVFTKNVGDDQYLYGRCVLSDGEIDGFNGTPTLNDLPITDYNNVEWGFTRGLYTEPVNHYFNRTVAQFARSAKLDINWVQYTTTQSIDAFQLNFVMPRGLIEYNDNGSRDPEDSTIEIQIAPYGTTNWTAPGIGSTGGGTEGSGGSGQFSGFGSGGGLGGFIGSGVVNS